MERSSQPDRRTALLVIDLQRAMFETNPPIDGGGKLLDIVQGLIAGARRAAVPVVYVRHDGGAGDELEGGTPGWQVHPALAPRPGEAVIDKRTPDGFHQTRLAETLADAGIGKLIIAGAQTEICVDTTCRRSFSLGFETIVVSDGHSTWDGNGLTARQIVRHHNAIWSGRFATLLPAAQIDFARHAMGAMDNLL